MMGLMPEDQGAVLAPPSSEAPRATSKTFDGSSQDQMLERMLREMLQSEDRALELTLGEQRRQSEQSEQKLKKIMDDSVQQQKDYAAKIAAFRSVAVEQQELLNMVAGEVRDLVRDYPKEFEDHQAVSPEEIKRMEKEATNLSSNRKSAAMQGSVGELGKQLQRGYFDKLREESCLARVVCSTPFDAFCTFVICVNAAQIGVSVEYSFNHVGEAAAAWQPLCELFFYCFYLSELLLKLVVNKHHFFWNSPDWNWNCFDFFLVLTATYDIINEYAADSAAGGANLVWMRLLRIMKMMRLMRVVRVMKFFRELRIMMNLIGQSIRALLWAFIFVALLLYMFGLCFLQGVTGYLIDKKAMGEEVNPKTQEAIEKYWDSVRDAMFTLFASVTTGMDWNHALYPMKQVGNAYYVLFLFYIAFFFFVVLNCLTGIFVDASYDAAAADRATVANESMNLNSKQGNKLVNLMQEWCPEGDCLDLRQFLLCAAEDDAVKAILSDMDIAEDELVIMHENLQKLHGGETSVRVKELSDGIMHLKGPAQSMDIVRLGFSCGKYEDALQNFMHYLEDQFMAMRRGLQIRLSHNQGYVVPLRARLHAARQMPVKRFSD